MGRRNIRVLRPLHDGELQKAIRRMCGATTRPVEKTVFVQTQASHLISIVQSGDGGQNNWLKSLTSNFKRRRRITSPGTLPDTPGTMLDSFEILTSSGVVLWSKTYAPVSSKIVNGLINDVFIEERTSPTAGGEDAVAARNPAYKKEKYTLKWTTAKDFGLIFVVRSLSTNQRRVGTEALPRQSTNHSCNYPGSTSYWIMFELCSLVYTVTK